VVDQERLDRLLDRVASNLKIAESNADAVRTLGEQGVVPVSTAKAVARAVGFRVVLVHEYIDVDNELVRDNLQRLDDLQAFVSHVAAWSGD
jgi:uncharacterized protein YutE (UPF0331/DUF86 family)